MVSCQEEPYPRILRMGRRFQSSRTIIGDLYEAIIGLVETLRAVDRDIQQRKRRMKERKGRI